MIYPDWWGSTPPTIETLTSWCETTQVELYMDSQLLAHETFHAAAQYDGRQTAAVESRIDGAVAQRMVYRWYSRRARCPRRIIGAYRRKLAQQQPKIVMK